MRLFNYYWGLKASRVEWSGVVVSECQRFLLPYLPFWENSYEIAIINLFGKLENQFWLVSEWVSKWGISTFYMAYSLTLTKANINSQHWSQTDRRKIKEKEDCVEGNKRWCKTYLFSEVTWPLEHVWTCTYRCLKFLVIMYLAWVQGNLAPFKKYVLFLVLLQRYV